MNLPNTTEMLLTALRYGHEQERARRLGEMSPEEWPNLLRLAHQHSVTAILRHRLKALGTPVPAGVMQQLRAGAANVAA
ncbi:MAG: hypothetical protein Q7O66_00490, partial [Dehalococcoidia bacterium]|nr:hypothetical protein [Dehalococcoidia bacterium]